MNIKSEKQNFCTECGTELDAEEAESPRVDKDGDIICDQCFENQYSYLCPLCGEIFDEDFSVKISPKHILVTKYAAEELGFDPGIYEIISYPFFADGIIELHFFKSSIKKIAELSGDFNEDDLIDDIHYVCEECAKKQEAKSRK